MGSVGVLMRVTLAGCPGVTGGEPGVAPVPAQAADDVRMIRRVLDEAGGHRIRIISKVGRPRCHSVLLLDAAAPAAPLDPL